MSYPILFTPGTTDFSGVGIGVIKDATECKVREQLNGTFELSMTYPIEGDLMSSISKEAIIAVKLRDRNDYQGFRIYSISKPLDRNVTIEAEHVSYKLAEIPLKNFSAGGIQEVLAAFDNHVVEGVTNPFTFNTDFINQSAPELITDIPVTIRDVMGNDDGMMLSKEEWKNGEWKFDNWTISFLQNRGSDKSASICYQYGSNVSSFNQDEDLSNTVTAVFPYWHTDYTDPNSESGAQVPVNVYGTVQYAEGHASFANERIAIVNVDEFFTQEERDAWEADAAGVKKPTAAAVSAKGLEALNKTENVCKPHVSLTIDPVELSSLVEYQDISKEFEQVNLGDIVSVHFADYGIDTNEKIVEIEYDVLKDVNSQVTIGDVSTNLATTIADIGKAIEENRAGMSVTRDSLLLYVKHEAGDLATQISMTEDQIYQRVSGNPSGWNMVPITGDSDATGGEGIDISFYNYGDPDEHYEAGSSYLDQYYFDDETGAVWKCVQQSGEYVWIQPTWTKDHGKVATGTLTQMNAAANYDHWMFSWLCTTDDTIYTCERRKNQADEWEYYWTEKEDQHIQLTGQEMYAERVDVYAYSEITSSANQIVMKVNAGGKMVLVELNAHAGLGSEFHVSADDINFESHTFNLSSDSINIMSDNSVMNEDGYVVYQLCDEDDVGAVELVRLDGETVWYNKKIVLAFQDGDAGWSLEDRSKNAKSELRGTNFSIEQMYDKEDWEAVTDEYLNDQSSFPGKVKAYLSMNPRWFGMYHKNDALSDTQKFDYRLGHFLQNGEVSETVGKIDQWWSGDTNPENPDEAMFLMEKPDDSSESFAMMVYDQIVMAGGEYTSKQSPRMFRIRSKVDPDINSVMRYNHIGIYDYFYKKSPYQINGKPMYRLTNDGSNIVPGETELEDGCFIIVYDGPDRDKESIRITFYGADGDTIIVTDTGGTEVTRIVFATGSTSGVYQGNLIQKYETYTFTSVTLESTKTLEITSSNMTVDLTVSIEVTLTINSVVDDVVTITDEDGVVLATVNCPEV